MLPTGWPVGSRRTTTSQWRTLPSRPSSSAGPIPSVPPSPMHCTLTIDESRAHDMDMEREEQFCEAQTDTFYNHQLL